jgi:hypothetical protein
MWLGDEVDLGRGEEVINHGSRRLQYLSVEVKYPAKVCSIDHSRTLDSQTRTVKAIEMTEGITSPSVAYCLALFVILSIYFVATTVLQYWRLRNIPGPPLAAWTNLWLMRQMNSEETFQDVKKRLHQKYGPVQRYGPNRVMFSDLSAIPTILGTSNIYTKVLERVWHLMHPLIQQARHRIMNR